MIMQGNNLTKSDIIDMYKETFNIDEVCHICGKNKMCIDDMSGDLENSCFICFDCDEKRHNTENEYERQEQMHDSDKDLNKDLDKTLSVSNLALAAMGL